MSIQNPQIFILIIIKNIMNLVMKNAQLVNMEEMEMKTIVPHVIQIIYLNLNQNIRQIV